MPTVGAAAAAGPERLAGWGPGRCSPPSPAVRRRRGEPVRSGRVRLPRAGPRPRRAPARAGRHARCPPRVGPGRHGAPRPRGPGMSGCSERRHGWRGRSGGRPRGPAPAHRRVPLSRPAPAPAPVSGRLPLRPTSAPSGRRSRTVTDTRSGHARRGCPACRPGREPPGRRAGSRAAGPPSGGRAAMPPAVRRPSDTARDPVRHRHVRHVRGHWHRAGRPVARPGRHREGQAARPCRRCTSRRPAPRRPPPRHRLAPGDHGPWGGECCSSRLTAVSRWRRRRRTP